MEKIKKEFIKKNLLFNNNINDKKKLKFNFKGLNLKNNLNNNNYYYNINNNQNHKKSLSLFLNSFNNNNNNSNILPILNISSFLKTINNNNENISNTKYETLNTDSKTERKKNNFSPSKFNFNSPGKINNIRNSHTKAKTSMYNFQNNNYSISTNNTNTLINNNIYDNYNTISTSSKKINSKIKKIIFENKKKINIKIIKKNLIKKEIKLINNNDKKFLKKLIFNLPININKKFTEKQIYLKKKKSKKNFIEKIKKCISNKIKNNIIINKNKFNIYNNNKIFILKILDYLFTSSFKFDKKIYIIFNWYNLSYLNISINKNFSETLSKIYFDIFNLIYDFNNNNKTNNKYKKNNSIKLINNFSLNSIFNNNNKNNNNNNNNIHHHSNSNCLKHFKNFDDIFYQKEIFYFSSKINKNFINLLCIKEWIFLSQKINIQSNKIINKKKFKLNSIKSKPIIINYKNFDEKFIVLSNKHIFQKKQKEKAILKNIFNKQQTTKLNLFSKEKQINNNNNILRNSLTFTIQNNSSYKSDIPSEILSKLTDLLTKNNDNYFIYIFDKLSHFYNLNSLTLEGNTLLNLSCQLNNLIISKYLLNKGLNPNLRNYFGNYPLHYAIGHKNFELINELIKFGAKEDVYNKQGLTPWDILQSFYK